MMMYKLHLYFNKFSVLHLCTSKILTAVDIYTFIGLNPKNQRMFGQTIDMIIYFCKKHYFLEHQVYLPFNIFFV